MVAAEDSSDEDNDDDSEKASEQKPRSLSGDDLGDSFSVNEQIMTKKGWVDEILERKDEDSGSEDSDGEDSDDLGSSEDADEESDEGLEEHGKDLSLKDWEQSDDDIGADSEDGDEDDSDVDKHTVSEDLDGVERLDAAVRKKAKRDDSVKSVKRDEDSSHEKKINVGGKLSKESDIPYIIEAPKTFEELCSLVDECSNSNIILIVNRIRKSNPITLAAENRKKMQV